MAASLRPVGEILQEGLDEADVSQALLARLTDLSTKHINQVVKGYARLSIEVAVEIEKVVPTISAEELLLVQLQQEIAECRDQMRGRK